MRFSDFPLSDTIQSNLNELGYQNPTPIQRQAIPEILAGRDVLGAAQTGTGKTAAYCLPLIQHLQGKARPAAAKVRTLVLVPTRELATQVVDQVRAYSKDLGLRSQIIVGGVPAHPQISALKRGTDILVATPGRLVDLAKQGAVQFDELEYLVLDEADRMLDLGFTDTLNSLLPLLPDKRQTLLFSATFSDVVLTLATIWQSNPTKIQVSKQNSVATTVRHQLYPVDKARKPELLIDLLTRQHWQQALIFVKTKRGVDELTELLQAEGFRVDSLHGDKPQAARLQVFQAFKAGTLPYLVATDVAARGLDIEGLPVVINVDLPHVAEDYIHRIGRTGRAGQEGRAVSLVSADEIDNLRAIEALLKQRITRREIPGFEPDHRVPDSHPRNQRGADAGTKKPSKGGNKQKKPKPPKPDISQGPGLRSNPFANAKKR
ncbi:DEAD/DEAH box helicase [Maribrevibacterium harenarium]|uniref:DEAD/DEAH box helicase n=1 Tax=Maribrevibacterium harenarium TaxID=2589817 RepID=A0A501WTZ9_9GAMM|nr:DEAD/DEAH box helicase [Maribrevibacterium harenarium]TPE51805.1 DEAD/DEAH box helicase [Maribrevibacterium harenarium]